MDDDDSGDVNDGHWEGDGEEEEHRHHSCFVLLGRRDHDEVHRSSVEGVGDYDSRIDRSEVCEDACVDGVWEHNIHQKRG